MLASIKWIETKYDNLIKFIEKNRNVIPFSYYILVYLKIPFVARSLLTLIMIGFTYGISYIIGFIILQSKAKNEVLSLITAFHNPIGFTDVLYLYYAFVYFSVLVPTIFLIGAYLFGGSILIRKFKSKGMEARVAHYFVAPIWYVFGGITAWFILKALPFIPYYLFYASKNSSFWEMLIKYIFMHEELPWINPSFDYDTFQRELFISLQSGNMLIVALIFFFIVYKRYFKKKENQLNQLKTIAMSDLTFAMFDNYWPRIIVTRLVLIHHKTKAAMATVLYASLGSLLLIVFVMVFVSHTAYQLGSFGKNLSQFDTDYVTVEYRFNNNVQKVQGIRIFQDRSYLVIRDDNNIIHNIVTDHLHVQTSN